MKVKVVWRTVSDYVRYDLKEIAFPSSLPDPPHIKKRRKLTFKEKFLVLKEASRLYAASWVRDIGPELRPNDYKTNGKSEDEANGDNDATKDKGPSTLEDLGIYYLYQVLQVELRSSQELEITGLAGSKVREKDTHVGVAY